jgi:carotenoid cleavage dioxygenase
MSQPLPDVPFLTGNFAPWPLEGEIRDVAIQGAVPRELSGTLYRIGPNPQFAPRGAYHWFDGDGMVHAFRIADGRVDYRNRFVRTRKFELERRAGKALFGGLLSIHASDPDAFRSLCASDPIERAMEAVAVANTNIVWHGGRLLALVEVAAPHELDPRTLETRGRFTFDDRLVRSMTAHPHEDPESGELLFFGYWPAAPYLRLHVASRGGELVRSVSVEVPYPTMMHDFIVTQEHFVIGLFPATFRAEHVYDGAMVRWAPELGARLGVIPRSDPAAPVRWFEIEPCYVFHFLNAFVDGDAIAVDAVRYPEVPFFSGGPPAPGLLTRWTLDLAGGGAKEERLDDVACEFPRPDERRTGRAYRHGFATGTLPGEGAARHNAILHYDLLGCARRQHVLAPGSTASEPVFVPRGPGSAEGDGFLLFTVYRAAEQRSDLVILDATDVAAAPLAVAKLPHRVPFGFHGNWAPGV